MIHRHLAIALLGALALAGCGGKQVADVVGNGDAAPAQQTSELSRSTSDGGLSASSSGDSGCMRRKGAVVISMTKYPSISQHVRGAIKDGQPVILHIDRTHADEHRAAATDDLPTKRAYDRDEYPPAMSQEGGESADVDYVKSGENRSAGASMGNQLRGYCEGQAFKLKLAAKPKPNYRLVCSPVLLGESFRNGSQFAAMRKPSRCGQWGDGSIADHIGLTKIAWSSWGATATGRGALLPQKVYDDPVPFTARLSRPTACGGNLIYTRMSFTTAYGTSRLSLPGCGRVGGLHNDAAASIAYELEQSGTPLTTCTTRDSLVISASDSSDCEFAEATEQAWSRARSTVVHPYSEALGRKVAMRCTPRDDTVVDVCIGGDGLIVQFEEEDYADDTGSSGVYYENCDAARDAGAAPLYRGDAGYGSHLDRDDDGIACEMD